MWTLLPTLIDDLNQDRCDVAMFAIGMLPQRMEKLAFTQPYMRSDIYGITTKSNTVIKQWADIDKPGVLVGVQAGTFMEPIMAQRLKQATLVRIQLPTTRERELTAGRIDVFMTDYPYSRRMMDNADWARLIESPNHFRCCPMAMQSSAAMPPGWRWWMPLWRASRPTAACSARPLKMA